MVVTATFRRSARGRRRSRRCTRRARRGTGCGEFDPKSALTRPRCMCTPGYTCAVARRLHILLSDDQYAFLDREANRSSVSMAELVRRALDTVFGANGEHTVVSVTHTLGRRP